MDTSDSENFESADEDFHSDTDNQDNVKKKLQPDKETPGLEEHVNQERSLPFLHVNNLNLNASGSVICSEEKDNILPSRTIPNVDSGIVCDDSEENRSTEVTENIDGWEVDKESESVVANYVEISDLNARSESKEVLVDSSDENMWENDDWEPITEGNKEPKRSDLNVSEKPDTDDENMWKNDEWETVEDAITPPHQDNQSWGGAWGSYWGVSTVLTTVSQGFSNVLEQSIGIPDPEQLARIHKAEEQSELKLKTDEESASQNFPAFGFGNLSQLVSGVSNLTKFVENTGSKVITGGLDTLETIGKKTMEVLQEGDPGLKNKRAFLKLDKQKVVLSQVLREAKEKAEQENRALQQQNIARKLNYETLFDDYHGLVHLEALEMLSKQCDIKLQTLKDNSSGDDLVELQETLDQIKELCELPEEEDEDEEEPPSLKEIEEKMRGAISEIAINISCDKLVATWRETESWLNTLKLNCCDEAELHQEALQSLAKLTAMVVEQFHKAAELLLLKEHRSTADEADSFVQLTTASTCLIGIVAAKFSEKLNMKASESGNKDKVNELITNVFYEAANSSSYIQDAFQLLVPVLQVGAV